MPALPPLTPLTSIVLAQIKVPASKAVADLAVRLGTKVVTTHIGVVPENKDDISKAEGLINFYNENPTANLYIATFVISFKPNMTIGLEQCIVFPTAWIPDIYVNPSNNGNLQSSMYKKLSTAVKRTPSEFLSLLIQENEVANQKKKSKKK